MYRLRVSSGFDAAHFLRGDICEKCQRVHGHSWRIEVELVGRQLNDDGVVEDFTEIKWHLDQVLERYDHRLLNDLDDFDDPPPTAEVIGLKVLEQMQLRLHGVEAVTVWESDDMAVRVEAQ